MNVASDVEFVRSVARCSFVALSLYQSRCGAVLMLTVQTLVTGAPWVALIFSRSSFELILRDRGKDN